MQKRGAGLRHPSATEQARVSYSTGLSPRVKSPLGRQSSAGRLDRRYRGERKEKAWKAASGIRSRRHLSGRFRDTAACPTALWVMRPLGKTGAKPLTNLTPDVQSPYSSTRLGQCPVKRPIRLPRHLRNAACGRHWWPHNGPSTSTLGSQ